MRETGRPYGIEMMMGEEDLETYGRCFGACENGDGFLLEKGTIENIK